MVPGTAVVAMNRQLQKTFQLTEKQIKILVVVIQDNTGMMQTLNNLAEQLNCCNKVRTGLAIKELTTTGAWMNIAILLCCDIMWLGDIINFVLVNILQQILCRAIGQTLNDLCLLNTRN